MATTKALLAAALLCILQLAVGYHMVCYYENWAQYRPGVQKMMPGDIPADLCTHIMYSFAKIENGLLKNYEWNDFTLYAQTVALKSQNPNLKVLLAVGGWTHASAGFTEMVSTSGSRRKFVDGTIAYLRKHKLDGLDIDWEYPALRGGRAADKANFALLCAELRSAFEKEGSQSGRPRLLLTAAVPAGEKSIIPGYDIPALARSLDFINLMTYDFHGSFESKTGHNAALGPMSDKLSVQYAANYWNTKGMPKDKIVVGMPTYGQSWSIAGRSSPPPVGSAAKGVGQVFYRDICSNKAYFTNTVQDPVAKVPYTYVSPKWISYDDKKAFLSKCEFIKQNQYGGAMIWALGTDDHNGQSCGGEKYPLTRTISNCMKSATPTQQRLTQGPPSATRPPSVTNWKPATQPHPVRTLPPVVWTPAPTRSPGSGGSASCSGAGFTCPSDGLHKDPCDCAKYYNCGHGIGHHGSCPLGTKFNGNIGNCDWPVNVQC